MVIIAKQAPPWLRFSVLKGRLRTVEADPQRWVELWVRSLPAE